jgi:hypothetical protein
MDTPVLDISYKSNHTDLSLSTWLILLSIMFSSSSMSLHVPGFHSLSRPKTIPFYGYAVLWFECVFPKAWVWNLTPDSTVLWDRVWWELIRPWGQIMDGFMSLSWMWVHYRGNRFLIKGHSAVLSLFVLPSCFLTWDDAARRLSPDAAHPSWASQPSEPWANKSVYYKLPNLRHSVRAAQNGLRLPHLIHHLMYICVISNLELLWMVLPFYMGLYVMSSIWGVLKRYLPWFPAQRYSEMGLSQSDWIMRDITSLMN